MTVERRYQLLGRTSTALNAQDFGFSLGASATNNARAVNEAILHLPTSGTGTVELPSGRYNLANVTIPQGVIVRGTGSRGTTVLWTYDGTTLFTLGGTGGAPYYGTGLMDLAVQPTASAGTTGTVVLVQGVTGAEVSNLYLEGPIAAIRSTNGVVIDGGNASTLEYEVRNVYANHFHTGFTQLTTGSQEPIHGLFSSIACNGDSSVDTTSTGLFVGGGGVGPTGQLTVYNSFDWERCGIGTHFGATAGTSIILGGRHEGNLLDVLYDNGCKAQSWYGGLIETITDNSSPSPHQYFGVVNGSGVPIANRFNQHPVIVSDLPASVNAGSRQFVSNATVTTFGTIVVGGGANQVPVYFDGTNWRIG